MRAHVVILFVVFASLSGVLGAGGQTGDVSIETRLTQLFPEATHFSPKTGNPPHFKAFGAPAGAGEPPVVGFAFLTTELEPLERGYDGPIQMLVGMDVRGVLSGLIVIDHNEPYGYFSVDEPAFPAQFVGKSIRERFSVGDDIDAVSTATITVRSATRAVRNASRRMARRFLNPEDVK